jgi:hypothetical protein
MKRSAIIAIVCLAPLAAFANPYILNPSSLLAFWFVAFWAFVVDSGIVALLLTWNGMLALRVFWGYFFCNAVVYFFLFSPLVDRGWPIPGLELLVVCVDGLTIKILFKISGLQGDNYRGVKWWNALVVSLAGNSASYFVGFIASRKPWEMPTLGD